MHKKNNQKIHRRRRRGPEHSALDLLIRIGGAEQLLYLQLEQLGYELNPTCRPYLRRDGKVSVRFVWRRRANGASVVYSLVVPPTPTKSATEQR